jgi:hypothetical protein
VGGELPGGTSRKPVRQPYRFAQNAPAPLAPAGSGAEGPTSGACAEERGASTRSLATPVASHVGSSASSTRSSLCRSSSGSRVRSACTSRFSSASRAHFVHRYSLGESRYGTTRPAMPRLWVRWGYFVEQARKAAAPEKKS